MARMSLDVLVSQLRAAYGEDLSAVVLYGSAAGGEHNPDRSDYNVLVIVKHLNGTTLPAASAVARAWSDAGNPAPLTFTEPEWRGSADVFAMEYADILERNRVLFGTPPFAGITVRPADLRLQLEREALGKVLRLRQEIHAAGGDGKRLVHLLSASLSGVLAVFRAFLRLHGERPAADNVAIVEAVARRARFDAAPLVRAARHLRGERLSPSEALSLVPSYLSGMERLVEYLDQFSPDVS